MKTYFKPFSGMYLPVRGPIIEPTKTPTSSTAIMSQ